MVFVAGMDRRIVDEVARTLADAGREVMALAPEELDPGELLMRMTGRPDDLVYVDVLPRLGGSAPGVISLEPLVRAVAAASPVRLILVTARAPDDPELAGLRRSGASYVVLRAERLLDLDGEVRLAGKRIVVPVEVAQQAAGGLLLSDVSAAVLTAVTGEECGRTVVIAAADGEDALRVHLERLGARPTRSRLGAALARFIGAPRLAIGEAGSLALAS